MGIYEINNYPYTPKMEDMKVILRFAVLKAVPYIPVTVPDPVPDPVVPGPDPDPVVPGPDPDPDLVRGRVPVLRDNIIRFERIKLPIVI